jgi:L-serine deaminase
VRRANVSGAAGGCQAETGSAACMAAGAAVELLGGTPHQSAQAVAITLKNMLGLVCDPVAGLVEVPCVKRNAAGAAQCFIAVDLALAGVESVIPADEVIDAMAQIGRRMDALQGDGAGRPGGHAHRPAAGADGVGGEGAGRQVGKQARKRWKGRKGQHGRY